jgi:hypothetical protein
MTVESYQQFRRQRWEEYLEAYDQWVSEYRPFALAFNAAMKALEEILASPDRFAGGAENAARVEVSSRRFAMAQKYNEKPIFKEPREAYREYTGNQPPPSEATIINDFLPQFPDIMNPLPPITEPPPPTPLPDV